MLKVMCNLGGKESYVREIYVKCGLNVQCRLRMFPPILNTFAMLS